MSRVRRPPQPRRRVHPGMRRDHQDRTRPARLASARSRAARRRGDEGTSARLAAFARYAEAAAETLPEQDGSLTRLRAAFAEDLSLVYEALLAERRRLILQDRSQDR